MGGSESKEKTKRKKERRKAIANLWGIPMTRVAMKEAGEGGRATIVKKNGKTRIAQCQRSWMLKAEARGQCHSKMQREVGKDREQLRSIDDLGRELPRWCKDRHVRRQDVSSEGGKGRRRNNEI